MTDIFDTKEGRKYIKMIWERMALLPKPRPVKEMLEEEKKFGLAPVKVLILNKGEVE